MPRYFDLDTGSAPMERALKFTVGMHHGLRVASLWKTDGGGVPVYFIANEEYFFRDGYYGIGDRDYPDNLERFVFFCKAALEACRGLGFLPDVIHCNDWQTAALPGILRLIPIGSWQKGKNQDASYIDVLRDHCLFVFHRQPLTQKSSYPCKISRT